MNVEDFRAALREAKQMGEAHGLLEAAKVVAERADLAIKLGAADTARVLISLSGELSKLGHGIRRINLSGGDLYDWRMGATNYRGTMSAWPMFFDRFVRTNRVTDLVVYGDCRPVHQAAMRMAKLRGIRVFVFEEGYIRPDWMTLERDGVNGYSPFDRDPELILAASNWLPEIPDLPPITADFRRRARDSPTRRPSSRWSPTSKTRWIERPPRRTSRIGSSCTG